MNELSVERTAKEVALEIKTLTKQAQQMVLTYAVEIGRRLVEAKSLLKHGEWGEWLRDEVEYSQSTANNFMRIFEEYGDAQTTLFGSNSQALGNLGYTKALKLLALPSEEREEFVKENDVDNLSTRELEQLIKERDEARVKAARVEALEKELEKVKTEAREYESDYLMLKDELDELKKKPVDVAVMEPDPGLIDAARKEAREAAEAELQAKMQKAQEAKKKAEEKLKELQDKQAAEIQKVKEAADVNTSTIKAERDAAIAKAQEIEKKLAVADPVTAEFNFHFKAIQDSLNKMMELLKKAEPEKRDKLKKALQTLMNTYLNLEA